MRVVHASGCAMAALAGHAWPPGLLYSSAVRVIRLVMVITCCKPPQRGGAELGCKQGTAAEMPYSDLTHRCQGR
jgi:hypothetical protein